MYRSASDRVLRAAALLTVGVLLAAPSAVAGAPQKQIEAQASQPSAIIGSDIAISKEHAELKLYLANGRKLTLSTVAGNNRGLLHSGVSGTPADLTQVITGEENGHHTYLAVVLKDRNMVSVTSSLLSLFGSGHVVQGTGIMLNNRMAYYGLEEDDVNVLRPGKRVRQTINPALA